MTKTTWNTPVGSRAARLPLTLIAEIGVNHDGSVEQAAQMIRRSAKCGFDAVKFQYWIEAELLSPSAPNAPYQGVGDQHELLRALSLGIDDLAELKDVARSADVGFIVTADGEAACHQVLALGVDALKIGSGDVDNPWLHEVAVAAKVPLIISTGMTHLAELGAVLSWAGRRADVTFLHCVSSYPTPLLDASLGRIAVLRELTGRAIGFSDHTVGTVAAAAALGAGASMVEKHVTHDATAPGPDHSMSLPLDEAPRFVAELRALYGALAESTPGPDELENRRWVRKGLYLTRDLPAGERIGPADLSPLRPVLDGLAAIQRDHVVGRRTRTGLRAGTLLRPSHLRDD